MAKRSACRNQLLNEVEGAEDLIVDKMQQKL
jgi:hypothetical protein